MLRSCSWPLEGKVPIKLLWTTDSTKNIVVSLNRFKVLRKKNKKTTLLCHFKWKQFLSRPFKIKPSSLVGILIILSSDHVVSLGHVNTKTSAVNPPPGLSSLEQLRLYVFHLFVTKVFPQAVSPPRSAWLRSKPVSNFLLSLPVSQPSLLFYTPQELVWARSGWRGSVK